jgi:WD repeat-containing protein 68
VPTIGICRWSSSYTRAAAASLLRNSTTPRRPVSLPSLTAITFAMSAPPPDSQQYTTPRRGHARLPSNAPPLQYTPEAYQQPPQPYASNPPQFNLHQATPGQQSISQPASVLPSNAGMSNVPGSLQPGAGANVRATSSSSTAPGSATNMQPHPIQTNAQQYAQSSQPPSRSNTHHSHSRSSPAGMDGLSSTGQKYIPFNQTPNQTPLSSNPKAFNAMSSGNPSGGTSHSPLNLTDIRSRTISDAQEPAMGTNMMYSYNDAPTNSNYMAPFATYAFDWCSWPVQGGGSSAGKMAVGSYLEDPHNFIQILDTNIVPQEVTGPGQSPYGIEYTKVAEATCAYPVTRLLWEPPSATKPYTDLLATSGDHLRLWSLPASTNNMTSNINRSANVNTREAAPQKLQPLALLSNSKTPEHTAPLTSLDWNKLSPKLIITSSIDTTCTIWDIPTLTAKTQLIAHDKEVFDVRFCSNSVDVFVSCGADGSVRMFDLRSLEHSTIIYEPAEKNDKCKIQMPI